MQFIFSTGSLYTYGTDRCFELARAAGFDGIEVLCDARWDTRQPEYLRRLSDRHQLPIVAVHNPFVPIVPGWPDDEPARIKETLRIAETIGAKVVVHHLPFRKGWTAIRIGRKRYLLPILGQGPHGSYRQWLLDGYGELQATTDVMLCIENMPARRILGHDRNFFQWNSAEEIIRFPALTLDTTHLGTWGIEPADFYPRLKGQVRHVHLSNFDGREHRRPEKGRLHLDRFVRQLVADNYQGVICLEMDPGGLAAGKSDRRLIAQLEKSLGLCRDWVAA